MSWTRFADAVVKRAAARLVRRRHHRRRGDATASRTPSRTSPPPHALGVRAKDCVAIEDSPTGVRSAVAAGCRTFAVPNVVDIPDGHAATPWCRSLREIDRASSGSAPATHRARRRRRWVPLSPLARRGRAVGAGGAFVARATDPPPPLADIPISAWAPYWVLPRPPRRSRRHGHGAARGVAVLVRGHGRHRPSTCPAASRPSRPLPLIAAIRDTGGAGGAVDHRRHAGGRHGGRARRPGTRAASTSTPSWRLVQRRTASTASTSTTSSSPSPTTARHVGDHAPELGGVHRGAGRPRCTPHGKLLTVSIPPIYDTERTADSGYWVYDYAAMGERRRPHPHHGLRLQRRRARPHRPLRLGAQAPCRRRRRPSTTTPSWCSASASTAATGWSAPPAPARASRRGHRSSPPCATSTS